VVQNALGLGRTKREILISVANWLRFIHGCVGFFQQFGLNSYTPLLAILAAIGLNSYSHHCAKLHSPAVPHVPTESAIS